MSDKTLHLYTDDDIGEVLDRAAVTSEVDRKAKEKLAKCPKCYPEGYADAVREYLNEEPHKAAIYFDWPVVVEDA